MMDFIMVPLTTGIVFFAIYAIFELIIRRKERLAIIDKIGDKVDPSFLEGKLRLPGYGTPSFSFSSLKIGCLLTGIGLGVLVGFGLDIMLKVWSTSYPGINEYQIRGAAYGSSVLLFGGIGLIIAFIIETKMKKK